MALDGSVLFILWLLYFVVVGNAKRRNGAIVSGEIGYRSSFSTNGDVREKCKRNDIRPPLDHGFAVFTCEVLPSDFDEAFDRLGEELKSIPLRGPDTITLSIMNPFNSSLTIDELFIIDSGEASDRI